jgi:hypothetical protein
MKKHCVCYLTILIAFVFCMAQYTIANDESDQLDKLLQSLNIPKSEESKKNEQHLARVIQAFGEAQESDDKETKYLLKQWENYLISASHYSNSDHLNAINKQLTDYYKTIADVGNIIEKTGIKSKSQYSSSWVDDLVNHFGIEFVRTNKDVILESWKAIFSSDEAFEQNLKNLIYTETMLFGSYKDYFGMFLTFYNEKLDQKAQKKMEAYKNIADNFLALIDKTSFASMHDTTVLKKVLSENKARQLNEEVFLFLKAHPLSHTFGDSRALKDFIKAIEK